MVKDSRQSADAFVSPNEQEKRFGKRTGEKEKKKIYAVTGVDTFGGGVMHGEQTGQGGGCSLNVRLSNTHRCRGSYRLEGHSDRLGTAFLRANQLML